MSTSPPDAAPDTTAKGVGGLGCLAFLVVIVIALVAFAYAFAAMARMDVGADHPVEIAAAVAVVFPLVAGLVLSSIGAGPRTTIGARLGVAAFVGALIQSALVCGVISLVDRAPTAGQAFAAWVDHGLPPWPRLLRDEGRASGPAPPQTTDPPDALGRTPSPPALPGAEPAPAPVEDGRFLYIWTDAHGTSMTETPPPAGATLVSKQRLGDGAPSRGGDDAPTPSRGPAPTPGPAPAPTPRPVDEGASPATTFLRQATEGRMAPPLLGVDADGQSVGLHARVGKVVHVQFVTASAATYAKQTGTWAPRAGKQPEVATYFVVVDRPAGARASDVSRAFADQSRVDRRYVVTVDPPAPSAAGRRVTIDHKGAVVDLK